MENSTAGLNGSSSGNDSLQESLVSIDKHNSHKIPFPPIGFCRHSRSEQLNKLETASLSAFNFSYYTVLLNLFSPEWKDEFKRSNAEAKALKIPMQLILKFGTEIKNEISEFIEICNTIFPFVEEVIILQKDLSITPNGLLTQILAILREGLHHVKLGVGGYENLEEIYFHKPDMKDAEFLSIPFVNGGNTVENLALSATKQLEIIHGLKTGIAGKEFYIEPMSYNAGLHDFITSPIEFADSGKIKQFALMAANQIGNFKSLIFSGASSISLYEDSGRTAFFEKETYLYSPEKIASLPFYYLLKHILEMNNGFIIQASSSAPSFVDAFVFTAGGKFKSLIINLSSTVQKVAITGLSAHATFVMFDEFSVESILLPANGTPSIVEKPLEFIHSQAHLILQPGGIAIIHE